MDEGAPMSTTTVQVKRQRNQRIRLALLGLAAALSALTATFMATDDAFAAPADAASAGGPASLAPGSGAQFGAAQFGVVVPGTVEPPVVPPVVPESASPSGALPPVSSVTTTPDEAGESGEAPTVVVPPQPILPSSQAPVIPSPSNPVAPAPEVNAPAPAVAGGQTLPNAGGENPAGGAEQATAVQGQDDLQEQEIAPVRGADRANVTAKNGGNGAANNTQTGEAGVKAPSEPSVAGGVAEQAQLQSATSAPAEESVELQAPKGPELVASTERGMSVGTLVGLGLALVVALVIGGAAWYWRRINR